MKCNNCGSENRPGAKFCLACGASLLAEEAPVAPAISRKAKSANRTVAMVLFPILIIAGIVFYLQYINPSVHAVIRNQPVVAAARDYDSTFVMMTDVGFVVEGNDLVFSLNDLINNRLIRFEYKGGQTPRSIMAYVAPTGQLVTAMSVSEHCGSTEFKIKDNKIFCARCASNWDMMTMEAYACCAKYFPDPIPSRVVGDKVHVTKAVVEKWAGRL
jgi:uncharacterized membrane protein